MNAQRKKAGHGRITLALAVVVPLSMAAGTASATGGSDGRRDDMSDPQVAHAAVTANRIDIEAAELALKKAETPEVRAFAQAMVADHGAVIESATALAERLGVVPEENEVSSSLQSGWQERRRELEELEGTRFEERYIEGEVAYHEAVIAAVRETLIPETENGELRELLTGVVPALEGHLAHARMVREELTR